MRILCVTDSLAMPRDNVKYESTWFYKLSHAYKDIDFIPKLQRHLTSEDILTPDFSTYYNPDLVILQLGVCDCAPRFYKRRWLFFVILERLFGKYWFYFVKKTFKRSTKFTDVSYSDFKRNVEKYYNTLRNSPNFKKLIIILIGASTRSSLVKSSPYLHDNIEKYNKVFLSYINKADVVIVDPLKGLPENCFVEDGYHTNGDGNDVVFDNLKKIIDEYV